MNNVALLADTHFGMRKNRDIFLDSQIRFFNEVFVPYLKDNNIKDVFILGDLFDNRNTLNIMTKNKVFNLFDTILKDFNFFILVGNHDSYFNSSIDVNSLKFFSKFSNVKLIEEITVYEMSNKKICMVPWIVDNDKFIDTFSKIDCDICLGHFNITGSRMNKVKLSEDGIPKNVFLNCKKVFSGHFHTRSVQKIGNCEIVYVGSPYQFDRGDMGEERGFIDLDLDTLNYKYINNSKSIKFVKINYPNKYSEDEVKGNLVDIYVNVSEDFNEKNFEKYLSGFENYVVDTPNVFMVSESKPEDINFKITEHNISSIPKLIESYVKTLKIENYEEVFSYLIELYKEAIGEDSEV